MTQQDCIVIGGGPGGSTAATLLARQGFDVTLFEREVFPREHVGESLLPASIPILETLGVIGEIESAGFTPKYGATMVWGRDPEPWSWHFAETNASYPHAYQVWRPAFDQMLLRNAERNGVTVHEGCRVVDVDLESGAAKTVTVESSIGESQMHEADWIVDASGQNGFLARRLDLRVNDEFFRNLAVYSYFRGADRLPEPDAGNIFIEAYEHGWSWAIPLPDDIMSVGVVVDAAWGGAQFSDAPTEQFYRRQLSMTGRTAKMLDEAKMIDEPRVIRDWSYTSQRLVGDGYILVGDAACFIDPLFSSGVHLALSSAVLASAYVTSALRDPEMREPAAEVYTQLYMQQYHQFREMAALFYASNRTSDSYFWEARRIVDTDGRCLAARSVHRRRRGAAAAGLRARRAGARRSAARFRRRRRGGRGGASQTGRRDGSDHRFRLARSQPDARCRAHARRRGRIGSQTGDWRRTVRVGSGDLLAHPTAGRADFDVDRRADHPYRRRAVGRGVARRPA